MIPQDMRNDMSNRVFTPFIFKVIFECWCNAFENVDFPSNSFEFLKISLSKRVSSLKN